MDSIVQGLDDVYGVITLIVARGAYWLSVVSLWASALAAVTLVAAELLGSSAGLGFTIFKARQFFLLDLMLSAVILISLLGVTMDVAMRMAEKRLIPWQGKG